MSIDIKMKGRYYMYSHIEEMSYDAYKHQLAKLHYETLDFAYQLKEIQTKIIETTAQSRLLYLTKEYIRLNHCYIQHKAKELEFQRDYDNYNKTRILYIMDIFPSITDENEKTALKEELLRRLEHIETI